MALSWQKFTRARGRYSIAVNPTVSDDPLASQRTELLGNLVAAQFDLERAIGELMQSGAGTGAAQSQLLKVGQLMRVIGSADAHTLAAMQASVAGLVGEAQAIVQQGREAANRTDDGDTLAAVDARTGATVQRISADLFERKIFDPYLRFDNAEEEAEYRKREAEREAYIKRELAKGTPEGSLNATNAAIDQIKDAGRYGADQSPDYQRLLNEAEAAEGALRTAISREASPAKGQPGTTPAAPERQDELTDILAALREAGVVTADAASTNPAHGLAVGKPAALTREI